MASSSIAVMGMGDEMKVMVLNEGPHDEEMAKKMHDIINATGPIGHIIDTGPPLSEPPPGQEEEFASINQFSAAEGMVPPPGTIIFSPQDMMRTSKPAPRGRQRGRPASTVKQEPSLSGELTSNNQTLEVPVACEICHKVMMTGKTLVQHMAIHSDMKPFQCPHCPKSFARKVHLQGHLVIHGIEKQFECPVCHQRFSRQDCVKVHMRLHDKSKCVYCDVCHKAFLTVGALNIHLRIHRGEKPFKCHLCSKCFTQKNHLITHIKRHTKVTDEHFTKKLGPRMFKCEHCTRAFIRLSDYERHVQWNHGAVAEGSVIDKLPTVSNLLDGEMKQTGLAPQVFKAPRDAMNSRSYKPRRGKKVMCSTSTQTDEGGGHVIIPRMYQGTHQVSAGTQMSAPPTPRPADDDMYENDIFDEGMDRNYSSDEDEDDPGEVRSPEEKKIFTVPGTSDMSSDPVQDAAFDAIVQGAQPKPVSETKDSVLQGSESTNDQHAIFLQEVVSSMTKQGLDIRESEPENEESSQEEEERMEIIENEPIDKSPPEEPAEEQLTTLSQEEFEDQSREGMALQDEMVAPEDMSAEARFFGDAKPDFHFNPGPLKRGRPKGGGSTRGRGRGSRGKKFNFGLTGAAELRFIRKSVMNCILNATTEGNNSENMIEHFMQNAEEVEEMETDESKGASGEDTETEGRVKRMAKKQHGKDFVCNMKNCETCLPSPKPNSKPQAKVKVKLKEKENDNLETAPIRKIIHVPEGQGNAVVPVAKAHMFREYKSPKPVVKPSEKPWNNEDPLKERLEDSYGEPNYNQEVPTKIEREESKMKVGNRVGTYPVDITASPLGNKPQQRQDFFVATSKADSIVSPPVELMSFCIPTYSCKLCGREFRFEGKLHRHIESVHQNKAIFSDDVKPGRGSSRYTITPKVTKIEDVMPPIIPQPEVEAENPEIAALRSEWDDDDDDDDDSMPGPSMSVTTAAPTVPTVTTYTPHQPITIVTRDITPMTTTVSGSLYSSGVKLNMNKLAGLLPPSRINPEVSNEQIIQNSTPRVSSSVAPSQPREPETIMAETLDMKCRRLLEKLFNHDLLLSCGLLEEHVSIVLGKVLQHYGVKMIEDYGQGQYEVLKYNLWRLIEWKVTMEQMEEFYTAGKSVEEMMDDIMNERVPLVSHHFVPHEQKAHPPPPPPQVSQAGQVTQVETVEVTDGQMVLQQVAGVLGGQLNLPEGVTQVVLAQDVSPDLLQGAHIVTIDPTTGQVISQVTADQVILTDAIGDELEQQVAALDGQVVVSQAHISDPSATQENLVMRQTPTISVHGSQGALSHGQVVVHAAPHQQTIKLETSSHTSAQQHHPHHHHQ